MKSLASRRTGAVVNRLSDLRWRFGELLHHRLLDGGQRSPVLTAADVTDYGRAHGVADPFLFVTDDEWHLFFEVENNGRTPSAVIAHATSPDRGRSWVYDGVVLEGDVHLSYPYVFEWEGEHYMLPDPWYRGRDATEITLYRARDFPYEWVPVADIVRASPPVHDCVVFRNDGRWWALAGDGRDLYLYHSPTLTADDWEPHTSNPVVADRPRAARPGGRPMRTPDGLVVPLQDCDVGYGRRLHLYRITELSESSYADVEHPRSPILEPTSGRFGWNTGHMHHFDCMVEGNRVVLCVDGNVDFGRRVFGSNWSIDVREQSLDDLGIQLSRHGSED